MALSREPIRTSASMYPSSSLHAAKHTSATSTLSLRLPLHLLANLDIDLEEFGDAAVQTYGFALVEIGFAVGCVDAF
jgi:hypothetical protein